MVNPFYNPVIRFKLWQRRRIQRSWIYQRLNATHKKLQLKIEETCADHAQAIAERDQAREKQKTLEGIAEEHAKNAREFQTALAQVGEQLENTKSNKDRERVRSEKYWLAVTKGRVTHTSHSLRRVSNKTGLTGSYYLNLLAEANHLNKTSNETCIQLGRGIYEEVGRVKRGHGREFIILERKGPVINKLRGIIDAIPKPYFYTT